jgi:hypothetical protein
MRATGKGERLVAAIAAVAVSLSILTGMTRLADGYAREALDSAPAKIIACLRSVA